MNRIPMVMTATCVLRKERQGCVADHDTSIDTAGYKQQQPIKALDDAVLTKWQAWKANSSTAFDARRGSPTLPHRDGRRWMAMQLHPR